MKKHSKSLIRKWYNVYTRRLLGLPFKEKPITLGDFHDFPSKAWRNRKGKIVMSAPVFLTKSVCLRRLWTNPHKAKRNRRMTFRRNWKSG